MHCLIAHIESLGKPRGLDPVSPSTHKNKYNYDSSQYCVFENCVWNPPVAGSGHAKLSTTFDVIRKFILLFAWDIL